MYYDVYVFFIHFQSNAHTHRPAKPPRYIRLHDRLQIIRETKTTIGTGLQTGHTQKKKKINSYIILKLLYAHTHSQIPTYMGVHFVCVSRALRRCHNNNITHTHTRFFVWKSRHWCYTRFYKFIIFTPFMHVGRPAASAVRSRFPRWTDTPAACGGLWILKKGFVPPPYIMHTRKYRTPTYLNITRIPRTRLKCNSIAFG